MCGGTSDKRGTAVPELLRISTEAACRVILTGEIDAATTPQLETTLPLTGSVWLDFAAVTFMDSAAVGALLTARASAKRRGDAFHISGLHGCALRVAQTSGLWDALYAE